MTVLPPIPYPDLVTLFDGRAPELPTLRYDGERVMIFVPSFAQDRAVAMTARLQAVWPALVVECTVVTDVPANYLWRAWLALQPELAFLQEGVPA